jgi:hypothetical protein
MKGDDLFNKNIDELKKVIKDYIKSCEREVDRASKFNQNVRLEKKSSEIGAYNNVLKEIDKLFK